MPTVEADFGVARADAALPFTLLMFGFAAGGIIMGRLTDRFGIVFPLAVGAFAIAAGYGLAAKAETLWQFALIHGVFIGFLGSSSTFGPVIADVSRWFTRHRGMAVAIAPDRYLAGSLASVIQLRGKCRMAADTSASGLLPVTILPLAMMLRRSPPASPRSKRLA